MTDQQENSDGARSSSAAAKSCGARWRDERPTTPGEYEGRVYENGRQYGPVKRYQIDYEHGELVVQGASVSIPLSSATWDNYQWREPKA